MGAWGGGGFRRSNRPWNMGRGERTQSWPGRDSTEDEARAGARVRTMNCGRGGFVLESSSRKLVAELEPVSVK